MEQQVRNGRTRAAGRRAVATATAALALFAVLPAAAQVERDEPVEPQEEPAYPSEAWTQREAENFARTSEAPQGQLADPAFQQRWQQRSITNLQEYLERQIQDPAWRSDGNLCKEWSEQCTGDPFRYPGVDPFYETAVVEPVVFLDRGGARLSGQVWAPATGDGLPTVVITNGSVQAPQTLYWWAAQALVEAGYVVLTFDPRGQGRSDNSTPDGQQGSNANPDVFVTNTIDAVDFLRSTPERPYEPNVGDERPTTAFNPLHARIDRDRLGLAGHSLGVTGVSLVQGIEPWPGSEPDPDGGNPVDVIVAWDNLALSQDPLAGFELVPRVPAMGQSGDYFLTPTPYTEPPDADEKRAGFLSWQDEGVDSFQLVIEGGTHYEWSLLPTFPTTAWEPGGEGGWGRPLAEHYTVAWFDRWLKVEGERGHADADARLLADDEAGPGGPTWRQRLSFYFTSSRDYIDRAGVAQVCEDIRVGCDAAGTTSDETTDGGTTGEDPGATASRGDEAGSLAATGGGATLLALLAVGAGLLLRRHPIR